MERRIFNHSKWVNWVKNELGPKCTFASYVNSKKTNGDMYMVLKVLVKNNLGGKDTYTIPIQKPLTQIYIDDYQNFVREFRTFIARNEVEDGEIGGKVVGG